jgi:hypothetical protein
MPAQAINCGTTPHAYLDHCLPVDGAASGLRKLAIASPQCMAPKKDRTVAP